MSKKLGITIAIIIYIITIATPIIEGILTGNLYSITGFICLILEEAAIKIRSQYSREDEIVKIFEDANEKEKEEIYKYTIKYKKINGTHRRKPAARRFRERRAARFNALRCVPSLLYRQGAGVRRFIYSQETRFIRKWVPPKLF